MGTDAHCDLFNFLVVRIHYPERERFLQSFPGYNRGQSRNEGENDPRRGDILTGYEELQHDLPPMAPRYERLELPHDWYMPGKIVIVLSIPAAHRSLAMSHPQPNPFFCMSPNRQESARW